VVDKVSKYYGSRRAVADLSFEIGAGECIGFLGLNGAGKSTTLRLLSCLLLPTSGRISVRGLDVVTHPHEIRKFIGYLPDTPPLYPEMTVREYLDFAGRLRGLRGAELDKRRDRVVSLCSVKEVIRSPISQLSHGYRQRVGIAQAIIHAPSLLILDEPIQGLDPVQIVEMRKMIGELRGEHTILLSTHILSEIEATCDRILVLHQGHIAAEGSEAQLEATLLANRMLHIEVRGEVEALKSALAPIEEVRKLQIAPSSDGVVRANLQVDDSARERVSRAIVQANLGLLSMHIESTGLEAVFLQLSTGNAPPSGGLRVPSAATTATSPEQKEVRR
ncbi:MAG TPA: ABC transporter ATP-binding protein, partial [Polyangiales bacterium]|nr:ABC transporter ATP-binding protein [Polyangiales bacterium]